MKRPSPIKTYFAFVAILFAASALSVSCSKKDGDVADGLGGKSSTGGGLNIGNGGAPPIIDPTECNEAGTDCAKHTDCCSGICDETSGQCGSPIQACHGATQGCGSGLDCCSLACVKGACAAECVSDNGACTSGEQCCGGTCTNGTCTPLNTACKTGGNDCAAGSECCSTLCGDNGKCVIGASYCVQKGDTCRAGSDCCSGTCTVPDGKELGTCGDVPPGPSNCSAGAAGTVCGDCNECCSRLCAPFGPSGVKICQPASGCRVVGELCRGDLDCCGGDGDSGLPGAGNGSCVIEPGAELGICRNAQSCSPQGNVCHFQDYACSISAAPNKCCDGVGNSGVCQLDSLGVPRCSGLGDACRAKGETCSSTIDCCDAAPCVPDSEGILHCGAPECVQAEGFCTVNADCCNGTSCVQPVGTTQGVCKPPVVPPVTACAAYGQTCTAAGDCCAGVPCTNGICMYIIK